MAYLVQGITHAVTVAILGTAFSFHVVPPPADTAKTPSFGLQGYTSESDKALVDVPQFAPATGPRRPSTYVSFSAPLSGRCGLAMWDDSSGKTLVSFLRVVDVREGEREFIHAYFPRPAELANTKWPNPSLDQYGITVICAVTDGEGAGPQTMINSEYYEVPVDRSEDQTPPQPT
jgi:hypothetical protein